MEQNQEKMYEVARFQPQYNWVIDPVAQLVKVDTRDPHEPIVDRFCSGFNINAEGLFLTAGHCLTEGETCYSLAHLYDTHDYRVSFGYQKGQRETYYKINAVLGSGNCTDTWLHHHSVDYAVFQLDQAVARKYGHLTPICASPAKNAKVIVASHPNGELKKLSFGYVKSVDEQGKIDHTAFIAPGSSGSPLASLVDGSVQKNVYSALGVNVSVSTDPNTGKPDHKHHYALSIDAIAESSRHVKAASYYLDRQGIFKKKSNQPDVTLVHDEEAQNQRSNNNDCCA